MMLESTCAGIELSRHLTDAGKASVRLPDRLFPAEFRRGGRSHVSLPQIGGMYNGDEPESKRRSSTASSAFGARQRPQTFGEFMTPVPQMISPTPGEYEGSSGDGS
jgi:excinuclease UvrABC helicase subunit UvrB